jgi:hypothetical protein
MAFKHGLSERLDELRFPSPRSPPSESAFPGYTSLSPGHSNFGSGFSSRPTGDVRANLQRRFTTDSSKFSSWGYLNQGSGSSSGSGSTQDPLDLLSSVRLEFLLAFLYLWIEATYPCPVCPLYSRCDERRLAVSESCSVNLEQFSPVSSPITSSNSKTSKHHTPVISSYVLHHSSLFHSYFSSIALFLFIKHPLLFINIKPETRGDCCLLRL